MGSRVQNSLNKWVSIGLGLKKQPSVIYDDGRSLQAIFGLKPGPDRIAEEMDNRGHIRGLGIEQQEEVVKQSTLENLVGLFGLPEKKGPDIAPRAESIFDQHSQQNQESAVVDLPVPNEMLPEWYPYGAEDDEYRVPQEGYDEGYSDQNNVEDDVVVAAPVPEKRPLKRKRRAKVLSSSSEEHETTEEETEDVDLGEKDDSSLDSPSIDLTLNKRRKTVADNQYTCPEFGCKKSLDDKHIEAHKAWHSVEVMVDKNVMRVNWVLEMLRI